jgi:N-acetylglutamate synthase-like GNAT family acetyltransferase
MERTRSEIDSRSSAPRIRRAIPSDASAVSALLRRAFQEFEPLYTPEAFVATVQPESGILKRSEEGPLWVAENDDGVIGTVAAVCSADSVMVRGMAVDPRARGQQIGRALLRITEDFACEQGYERMSLYTTAFLLRAIRLYQCSGFEFTGEKTTPHGTELLRMVRVLDNKGA